MASRFEFRLIPGSDKVALPGATVVASTNLDEVIEVTVLLRRQKDPLGGEAKSAFAPAISGRKYLDRHQYQTTYGASTSDIKKVEQFAHESGLAVADIQPGRRTVKLSGTVGALTKLRCRLAGLRVSIGSVPRMDWAGPGPL